MTKEIFWCLFWRGLLKVRKKIILLLLQVMWVGLRVVAERLFEAFLSLAYVQFWWAQSTELWCMHKHCHFRYRLWLQNKPVKYIKHPRKEASCTFFTALKRKKALLHLCASPSCTRNFFFLNAKNISTSGARQQFLFWNIVCYLFPSWKKIHVWQKWKLCDVNRCIFKYMFK